MNSDDHDHCPDCCDNPFCGECQTRPEPILHDEEPDWPDLGESAHEMFFLQSDFGFAFPTRLGQPDDNFFDHAWGKRYSPPPNYDPRVDMIDPRTGKPVVPQKPVQPARPGDLGLAPSPTNKADLGVEVRYNTNTDSKGFPVNNNQPPPNPTVNHNPADIVSKKRPINGREIDRDSRPPKLHDSRITDVQHIIVDRMDAQMTGQAKRIFREVVPKALELFARKSKTYELAAGNLAEELGVKGQWGDIYRKVMKLKAPLWEGKPVFTDGQYAEFEDTREVLEDLLGHVLLALDMLEDK